MQHTYSAVLTIDKQRMTVEQALHSAQLLEQRQAINAAEALYRLIVQQAPRNTKAWQSLGNFLYKHKQLSESIFCYQHCIALQPNYAKAYNDLANCYQLQHQSKLALRFYQRALALQPNFPSSLSNMGLIHLHTGQFKLAITYTKRALQYAPKSPDIINNYAECLRQQGQYEQAITYYQQALAFEPLHELSRLNLATTQLLLGYYQQGWNNYTLATETEYPSQTPIWDGCRLKGKTLLIHMSQSTSVNVLLIRFVKLLKAQGAKILLKADTELQALLKSSSYIDQFVSSTNPAIQADYQIYLRHLPQLLNVKQQSIPTEIPYLRAKAKELSKWFNKIQGDKNYKIGIVWQTSQQLSALLTLTEIESVHLYNLSTKKNLQIDPSQQLKPELLAKKFHNIAPELLTLTDIAAAIIQLDLIIGIDHYICHIAGALGKPCWLALSYTPSWYWQLNTAISSWYPKTRLFRSQQLGQFTRSFAEIKTALLTEFGFHHCERYRNNT